LLSVALLASDRWILGQWWSQPSFGALLRDPGTAPRLLWVVLPLSAIAAAWTIGKLDRSERMQNASLALGVDLRRSLDLWQIELGTQRYVYVWLQDGTLLYGWPKGFSSNRKDIAELSLCEVQTWSAVDRTFKPYDHRETTVLIDGNNISYIEFDWEASACPPRLRRFPVSDWLRLLPRRFRSQSARRVT
jgi:hypothetical protein